MCTISDTKVTTSIISTVRRSIRKPISKCAPPEVIHWYTVPLKVWPSSTSMKMRSETKNDTATSRMVMRCVHARPSVLPNSPAATAPASGAKGTSRYKLSMSSLTFQLAEVIHVNGAQIAEQHHQDRQPDRRFGCCHGEDEKYEHLPCGVVQVMRKGDEIGVHRKQHQFDRHQQHDDVLAVEENAHHAYGEQQRPQHQIMR